MQTLRSAAMKKKQTKADFLREWGLPYPSFQYHHLRYKNPPEKGVYWYYFSLYVRQRDVEQWGTCISCGKAITMETAQGGHFLPASSCGRDLLFDERNVNAECARCNAWDEGHLFGYERGLIERYGQEAVSELKEKYAARKASGEVLKDWSAEKYREMIKKLPSYNDRVL